MKFSKYLSHSAWVLAVIVGGRFLGRVLFPFEAGAGSHLLLWDLASDLVTALVLTFLADRSLWTGWRLPLALSGIYSGLQAINAIEGIVYLHISSKLVFVCLGTGVVLLPFWKMIFRQNENRCPRNVYIVPRSLASSTWRVLVGCLSYVILYIIAGMIIFPFVKDFYATQKMPSLPQILVLQILLRGPAFVAICVLMLRMVSWPRSQAIFAVAFMFTLLSGVVPLMAPSPIFPDAVRWVHLCEVTSSNFVFGLIVAGMFSSSNQPKEQGVGAGLPAR